MTRHMDRQEYLPGCIWSVFHILDYHYWHSSRKISSRRKHRRGKHTICCGYPKTISFEHYADEAHEYLDADAVPLINEQKTAKPTDRNLAKAHIKELIAKEMQQADSFRRLRSSKSLDGLTPEWSNPIIIIDKSADATESRLPVDKLVDASLSKNNSDSTKLNREISDVLEIFKINKNMFLEILHDPDVKAKNFHVQLAANSRARLKKSGSFPLPGSPDHRNLKPSTLERKSKETWSFRKGENPKSDKSKSLEDLLQMPKGVQANDTVVLAVSEESGFPPPPLSQGSNKHGPHHSFMGHLKYMMKKIKHGLRESKRQSNQTSKDSLLNRVSSRSSLSTGEKDGLGTLEDVAIHQDGSENCTFHETSSSSKDLSMTRLSHMRRVSSLNESVDRYARLFEYGLTKEAKWHEQKSKSLRLSNDEKIVDSVYRIKSFKRRLSLQDPDSCYPLPTETTSEELQSENENTKSEIHSNSHSLRALVDEENLVSVDECPADCINEEITNNKDQDFGSTLSFIGELEEASHVSVLESHVEDHITDQTKFRDFIEGENEENTKVENHFLQFEIEDPDFNYVKDVLEISGLIQQGYIGSWHSLDQPLSPTLFEELEAYLHHELESSSDDVCNHQLLFDLINEVLLHMYSSSLAYFPKNFSFAQRVRPLPKGSRILEEVWKRISWYRNPKSKMEQSLDDIVARDLAKDESWLDLQVDLEDMALDLEEWIFDELVDEIMCS